ncbi:type 3 dihydrofolate reductase [Candidatus Tachikawaea gelatinosa]|uniref:Dihydrofolate reductase n=1 Tax=Candidatus Tachikawaea gelatinosa TaxID=1410383 RepID=A0A090AM99_9ENTR|nr:type 3 dihydrofolate reductase [Candidatus Tachikawaea gelatinosa]BAP58789.1 dihydrofolate reductase [Candidatus Tachikawaea gelatinosa]
MISLIAALTKNYIIGIHNTIPWYIPEDLLWFKRNTINKPIIMGRLTFESIGYPLKNRINIVVSRKKLINFNEVIWVKSIEEAITLVKHEEEAIVIGGGLIYDQMLRYANRLYLTHINFETFGDTYFPIYNSKNWKVTFRKLCSNFKNKNINYYFEILDR